MKRRAVLGSLAAAVAGGLAGCSGTTGGGEPTTTEQPAPFEHVGTIDASFVTNGEYPTDDDPADGYPPAFPDPPAAPDADPSGFETIEANGESVRLAPIDVVEDWYRRGEARFVDARGIAQYERAHVYGAVASPAQQGSTGSGIPGWPTDERVITYCGCPHHLSSIRAAGLQKSGYTNVYALDEGFNAWGDREYPMAGVSEETTVSEWTLEGVDPDGTGSYAWVSGERQYEAAPIRADGTYTLHATFSDAGADTEVEVSTPSYTVRGTLGELAASEIVER